MTYTHSVDGAVGPLSLSSTGGVINIGSLNAGNITNIQVDSLGCNSNTVDVTLTNPTDPTIAVSIVEPTCALGDGQINISGLTDGFNNVTYNTV